MDTVFTTIAAADKVSGSAGNAQTIQHNVNQGVACHYNHLISLLASAAYSFLGNVSRGFSIEIFAKVRHSGKNRRFSGRNVQPEGLGQQGLPKLSPEQSTISG